MQNKKIRAPQGLGKQGADYWKRLHENFSFEATDEALVMSLCRLIDRLHDIAAIIEHDGVAVVDRFNQVVPHRLLEAERSTALAAGRLWRELGLATNEDTDPSRLPLP